ncbi:hypothetical protein C8F04DRAFT_345099 [Mycena alexandri]|uniref:Transmembrane protein n=1 Tax=Mycena alexandri TaxID=1745969 RepID=A0AAD6TH25_9AGAR|nr:hypothetical protein C8F04DRAFT_345099 [Mycena alexandri]
MAPVEVFTTMIHVAENVQQHFDAPSAATLLTSVLGSELTTAALPSVVDLPSQTLAPQLDHTTRQSGSANATSSPAPALAMLSMDPGDMLSQKVLISIIVGLCIFVACYASFCCFWQRCSARARSSEALSPSPFPGRAVRTSRGITVAGTPFAAGTSSPRSSSYSASTLAAEGEGHTHGVLAKDNTSAMDPTDAVEMGPLPQRPQRARVAHSRPRLPLVEVGM